MIGTVSVSAALALLGYSAARLAMFAMPLIGGRRLLNSMLKQYLYVFIQSNSRSLASGLVSGKLAACVNILPGVTSVYEWEGKVAQ